MQTLEDKQVQEAIKDIYSKNPWMMEITEGNVVYIAGPMSGLPDYNRQAFWLMEHALKMRQCVVLSPAHYDDLNLPYSWYIRHGLRMVLDSDTQVMLNGWSNSKGACLEHRVALTIENRIFYKDNEKAII